MRFWSILRNRLRIHFSDKLFVLAILILPVLLSSISGYAQRKEKLGYVPVFLVDEDKTESSELLAERLANKEGLRVKTGSLEDGENEVSNDDAEAMIVIGKGFEEKLSRGDIEELITLVKSPSAYSAELIKEIVASEVLRIYSTDFTYDWLNGKFDDIDRSEVFERLEDKWQPSPVMTIIYEEIEVEPKGDENITIPPFAAASLGLLILFIMLGLLFGSGWLCEEKLNGTIQRAISVKGALRQLFLGNIAALFIMGLFLAITFVGIQWVFFGVLLIKGPLPFLVMVLYILCVSSVSMFLSAFFKTPHQLQASAPVLALVTGIMGGCLWNLAGVPKPLLSIALLTPQGWALRALTDLYATPGRIGSALPAASVLGAASIGFVILSYFSLKRTLKNIWLLS
jgi:ABC-2 type transport system permease protein